LFEHILVRVTKQRFSKIINVNAKTSPTYEEPVWRMKIATTRVRGK